MERSGGRRGGGPGCRPQSGSGRLLTAVAESRGRGPHLEAFFGCMYYAAMRPAETEVCPDPHGTRLRPGQAALRPPARRDLVLAPLRCGPGPLRSPRGSEHRGPLPSVTTPSSWAASGSSPTASSSSPWRSGTASARVGRLPGEPGSGTGNRPEELVRNTIAEGGTGNYHTNRALRRAGRVEGA